MHLLSDEQTLNCYLLYTGWLIRGPMAFADFSKYIPFSQIHNSRHENV